MIGWLIDFIRDLRGWRPKASPVNWRFTTDFPPFNDFRDRYPNHPAARIGVGPIKPWQPKVRQWRRICRALQDFQKTAPKYELDYDGRWDVSDKNCVGRAISIHRVLGYAGVPAAALALLPCRSNGSDHLVCGIAVYDGWVIIDMYDEKPRDWIDTGLTGIFGLAELKEAVST